MVHRAATNTRTSVKQLTWMLVFLSCKLREAMKNQLCRSHPCFTPAPSHHNSFSSLYLGPSLLCPSSPTDQDTRSWLR